MEKDHRGHQGNNNNNCRNSIAKIEKSVFTPDRDCMVREQIASRGVRDKKVLKAMLSVPREKYVTENNIPHAYEDRPLAIGFDQTISQPYIVALMTESLEMQGSEKVLEIGTGSGYQTAILAEIAMQVYSVEIVQALYENAKTLLAGYNNIRLLNADGYLGWPKYAPFDRVILTAAPENIPEPLIGQLKDGGIMVLPSGPPGWGQTLLKVRKINGKISTERICDVAFVPLIRK